MFALKSKSLKTELYRKAVHLSSLWMPLFISVYSRNLCILVFSTLLVLNLFFEYAAYRKTPLIGAIFRRIFIKTLRNEEIKRTEFVPSGSVYILAAALLVSVCFSTKAAVAAMCIVLISDSLAALIGKFFGSFRFSNGKSVEGTLTFLISTLLISRFFFPAVSPFTIFLAAILTTLAEFFENKTRIDDNLSVPLVSGFILNLIS